MAVKDKPASNVDCAHTVVEPSITMMEWSAEEEIQLFKALGGLKPIGINKHFFMALICVRLSEALNREINPDVVWAHLHTLYNLDMLESIEPLPFPQDVRDFELPTDEVFAALMAKKQQKKDAPDTGTGGGSGVSSSGHSTKPPVAATAATTGTVDTQEPANSVVSTIESAGRGSQRRQTSDRASTASPIVLVKCKYSI